MFLIQKQTEVWLIFENCQTTKQNKYKMKSEWFSYEEGDC